MMSNWFNKKTVLGNSTVLTTTLIFLIGLTSIWIDLSTKRSFLSPILITSIILSSTFTGLGIKKLKSLKINQIIRQEGPENHQIKKGTPTMGGLIVIPIGILIACAFSYKNSASNQLLGIGLLSISYMIIGLLDDWKSFSCQKNTGLRPKEKITLQAIIGFLFLVWANSEGLLQSNISLFNDHSINVGMLIWPIAILLLIAESNATNLTDGLDGLASGCGAIIFTGLSIELIFNGGEQGIELANFCIAMAGSWLGFLIFNRNPARIFMGDTGSLAMGAALLGVGLLSNRLWSLFIMGIVFFAESISVILQVITYKITKRIHGKGYRIFRMAPLHHHFELNGAKEVIIVRNFWLATIGFVVLALFFNSNY